MTAFCDQIRFGVYSGPQHTIFEHCLELWQRCEELGYDWLSVFDHFMPIAASSPGVGKPPTWRAVKCMWREA